MSKILANTSFTSITAVRVDGKVFAVDFELRESLAGGEVESVRIADALDRRVCFARLREAAGPGMKTNAFPAWPGGSWARFVCTAAGIE